MTTDPVSERRGYGDDGLEADDLQPDPIAQLQAWLHHAGTSDQGVEASAMTLATVDREGRPAARTVLLRRIKNGRLYFYTSYGSRKARHLDDNANVALLFRWANPARQVEILLRRPRHRRGVRRLLRLAPPGIAARRARLPPVGTDREPPGPRRAPCRHRGHGGDRRGAPAGRLGRLRGHAEALRVLAGPGRPAPRPLRVRVRAGCVAHLATGALTRALRRSGTETV